MEYTNDIILKVRYKIDEMDATTSGKHKGLKRIVKKIEDDEYLTLVLIVSTVAIFIDFMIIKRFIEIINLL